MATALVTGGTSGLGAEFARALARRGFDLVLVARNPARLETMAADLRASAGVSVDTLAADLGDRADVARVVDRITDDARPIDLLVNNAGFGLHTPLTSVDTTAHDEALEVMVRTVLVLGERREVHRGAVAPDGGAGVLAHAETPGWDDLVRSDWLAAHDALFPRNNLVHRSLFDERYASRSVSCPNGNCSRHGWDVGPRC